MYIIELALKNDLDEVVVTYKDRLCRIGYDLIEYILSTRSNAKITVINKDETAPYEQITRDLVEIITVYSAKIHGKRSHQSAGNIVKRSKSV